MSIITYLYHSRLSHEARDVLKGRDHRDKRLAVVEKEPVRDLNAF